MGESVVGIALLAIVVGAIVWAGLRSTEAERKRYTWREGAFFSPEGAEIRMVMRSAAGSTALVVLDGLDLSREQRAGGACALCTAGVPHSTGACHAWADEHGTTIGRDPDWWRLYGGIQARRQLADLARATGGALA